MVSSFFGPPAGDLRAAAAPSALCGRLLRRHGHRCSRADRRSIARIVTRTTRKLRFVSERDEAVLSHRQRRAGDLPGMRPPTRRRTVWKNSVPMAVAVELDPRAGNLPTLAPTRHTATIVKAPPAATAVPSAPSGPVLRPETQPEPLGARHAGTERHELPPHPPPKPVQAPARHELPAHPRIQLKASKARLSAAEPDRIGPQHIARPPPTVPAKKPVSKTRAARVAFSLGAVAGVRK